MHNYFKHTIVVAFLVSALLLLLPSSVLAAGVTVIVDGNTLPQSGVKLNGNTLVPMRGIFEALGAEVKWDGATKSITGTRGTTVIKLTIGHYKAYINDEGVELAAPATSVNGTTMVPLRFIGEALGAEVKWDGPTQTANVTSSGSAEAADADAPKIKDIIISPQRSLVTGDTLTVEISGEAGCKATFDIMGVRNGVPMHEETTGRYLGSLTISKSLKADAAVLIGRLTKDGHEASIQAKSTVTINTANKGRKKNSSADSNNGITLSPAPNSTTDKVRPTISARFPNEVSEGSLRFWLDDEELTNQLTFNTKRITWRSASDLSAGRHTVRLSGTDDEGTKISESWSFSVGSSASDSDTNSITVYSPKNGNTVASEFTITGKTSAKAVVTIDMKTKTGSILNLGDLIPSKTTSSTVTADASGNFSVTVNAKQVFSGSSIELKLTSESTSGVVSETTTITVTRQ